MKFSVTVPAYKAKYLKECIESVLAQTYRDFELLIVDDASPEDLKSIVKQFRDSRIRYYRNEKNCGAIDVVDNWNKCLEYAKGEWVICMGDDDKLLPNCLEEYAKLAEKHPQVQVMHGWTEIIDENSDFSNVTASRTECESAYSLIWHRWFSRDRQFVGDFAYKRETLKSIGGFYKLPMAWASDDITAITMAEFGGIANTQALVFQYRENSRTISSTGNVKVKMEAIRSEIKWYEEFFKRDVDDTLDLKYKQSLEKGFSRHFQKKYAFNITQDLLQRRSNVFYWIRHRDEYGLSLPLIIYSFIISFKS